MEINFISAEDIDLLILYLSSNVKKSNVYLFKDRTQTSILSFRLYDCRINISNTSHNWRKQKKNQSLKYLNIVKTYCVPNCLDKKLITSGGFLTYEGICRITISLIPVTSIHHHTMSTVCSIYLKL
jgi:hypothetical protein